MVFDPDRCDFKDIVNVLDITFHIGPVEMLGGVNFFSGHHRGQCSHHSPGCGGNNMIKRRRMLLFGLDLIEFYYPTMNSIIDRVPKSPSIVARRVGPFSLTILIRDV